jgi:hypothetical protein
MGENFPLAGHLKLALNAGIKTTLFTRLLYHFTIIFQACFLLVIISIFTALKVYTT